MGTTLIVDFMHKSLRSRMLFFDIAGLGVWLCVFIFVCRHILSNPPEPWPLNGKNLPSELVILGLILINGWFFLAIGRWNRSQIDHQANILPINFTDKVYWLLLVGSVAPVLLLQQFDGYFLRDSIFTVFLLLLCAPSMNRLPPWIAIATIIGLMVLFTLSSSAPNKWFFCFMMISYGVISWALLIGVMAQASSRQRVNQTNLQLRQANTTLTAMLERNERLRISRDLHDDMGHDLSVLNLQLQLCKSLTKKDEMNEQLAEAQVSARQLYNEVRELVQRLRAESTTSLDDGLNTLIMGCNGMAIDIENTLLEPPATWIPTEEWLLVIKHHIDRLASLGCHQVGLQLHCIDRWLVVSLKEEQGALNKLEESQNVHKRFSEKLEQMGGRMALHKPRAEPAVLELFIPVLVHNRPTPLPVA